MKAIVEQRHYLDNILQGHTHRKRWIYEENGVKYIYCMKKRYNLREVNGTLYFETHAKTIHKGKA